MFVNDNNYVLLNNDEYLALRAAVNTFDYIEYARYYDRHNTGQKFWWVFFRLPVSGTKLFTWGMIVQNHIMHQTK